MFFQMCYNVQCTLTFTTILRQMVGHPSVQNRKQEYGNGSKQSQDFTSYSIFLAHKRCYLKKCHQKTRYSSTLLKFQLLRRLKQENHKFWLSLNKSARLSLKTTFYGAERGWGCSSEYSHGMCKAPGLILQQNSKEKKGKEKTRRSRHQEY